MTETQKADFIRLLAETKSLLKAAGMAGTDFRELCIAAIEDPDFKDRAKQAMTENEVDL